jgi:hypothetical protein
VRRLAFVTVAGWALAWSSIARADCADDAHLSTCFDADTFLPHAGPGTFTFIGGSATTPPGAFTLGLFATYLSQPVVLVVPSADPKGAEAVAVDRLADATLLFSFGLSGKLDVAVALPVVVARTGVGVSPLTSQASAPLAHSALRDLRVGAGYRLAGSSYGVLCPDPFGLAARFDLALPTGDENSFAGEASAVAIPSVAGEVRRGPFSGGFELGARLRKTADLAGSRVGSQLSIALGLGADVLDRGRLGFMVEAFALPTLAQQDDLALDSTTGERKPVGIRPPLVPAEWHASVRSADVVVPGLSVALGAGTPLLLTGESGVTSPRWRATLALRYTPPKD